MVDLSLFWWVFRAPVPLRVVVDILDFDLCMACCREHWASAIAPGRWQPHSARATRTLGNGRSGSVPLQHVKVSGVTNLCQRHTTSAVSRATSQVTTKQRCKYTTSVYSKRAIKSYS